MSASRVAVRYAKAFVDLLQERGRLDDADAFVAFCDMASGHAQLHGLLTNITVAPKDKRKVVGALIEKLGAPELTGRFLLTLVENGRIGLLTEMKAAVTRRLHELKNVKTIQLTTAAEPTQAQIQEFEASMAKTLAANIVVNASVDPDIIGGAIARVGSVVYDGSVSGRLDRLRKDLAKES